MRLSLTVIAGLLATAGAASAEPPKNAASESSKPAKPESRTAAIVLASVEAVRVPTGSDGQPAASPVKRQVAPRITTCRCGPPHVQPDPDSEDE